MENNTPKSKIRDTEVIGTKPCRGRIIKYEGKVALSEIPNVNYASFLLQLFAERENDVALLDTLTETSYTYGDIHRHVLRASNGLSAAGVEFGDTVLLISSNQLDVPLAILSIMLLGATCVPANPNLTKEELVNIVKLSNAKWAVTNKNMVGMLEDIFMSVKPGFLRQIWILGDTSDKRPSFKDLMKSFPSHLPKLKDKFDSAKTVALMPFSSGTTGLPKGVMLSHRNILSVLIQIRFMKSLSKQQKPNPYERTLMILPMYHIYGFNTLTTTLFTGGTLVLLTKFSLRAYFEAIEKYRITFSPIVPHLVKSIADTPLIQEYDMSSLIGFTVASAPVSGSAMESLVKKSGKMAYQGYGMTESFSIFSTTRGPEVFKPNSVGPPGPFVQAKVIDIATSEVLGEREEGEICFQSPMVMIGYVNNPQATAEMIDSEGWLHTGDIGYFDEDNFFYITDRMKDLIKVKGFQVSPTELENIIKEVEGVRDVAVAGVPNARLGEAPRAWVVPSEGAIIDPKALIQHVADRVVPYKQLTGGVEFIESIPRNYVGKILRRHLQKSYKVSRSRL